MEERINQVSEILNGRVEWEIKKKEEKLEEEKIRRIEGVGKKKNIINVEEREERNVNEVIEGRSKRVRDTSIFQELQPPKFGDEEGENPKKFIEEIEEFLEIKEIPEEWKITWFRKIDCVLGD